MHFRTNNNKQLLFNNVYNAVFAFYLEVVISAYILKCTCNNFVKTFWYHILNHKCQQQFCQNLRNLFNICVHIKIYINLYITNFILYEILFYISFHNLTLCVFVYIFINNSTCMYTQLLLSGNRNLTKDYFDSITCIWKQQCTLICVENYILMKNKHYKKYNH